MRSRFLFGIVILLSISMAQAGDWPMFGHDAAHTGVTDEIVEPPLELLWKYTMEDDVFSPVVSGNVVFVSTWDFYNDNVYLYALDTADGTLKWKYKSRGAVPSSPAISGNVVYYIGDGGSVYALDIATGTLKWIYATRASIYSSPTVSDGVVFVGTCNFGNYVYALYAATGALKWKYETGGSVVSSPAVSDGVVYVGSWDSNVYALDEATGTLKWKYKTGNSAVSSPTVSDGMVYVGSTDRNDSNVYALDAATGALKWKYKTGNSAVSSPTVSDSMVYVGSQDSNVYALDRTTGILKWKFKTGNYVTASPTLSGDFVYVGSGDGNLYALDGTTGTLKWKYTIGDSVESSPVVSGNVVYVGSTDTNLYAFKPSEISTSEVLPDITQPILTTTSTGNFALETSESQNQTNWMLVSAIIAVFLIGAIILLILKSKESMQEDKTSQKYNTQIIALIMFLTIAGFVGTIIVENENLIILLCYIFLILIIVLILGLIRRFWSPKEVMWAVGLVFVVETVLILTITLLTGYIETVFVYLITSSVLLIVGWVGVVFWVIQEWNLKIQSPIVKSQTFATETNDTINKPTKTEAPFMPISETHNEVCLTSASKTETISKSQRNNKKIKHVIGFKKIILLTILLSVIVIGSFGFTVYQKYSPLAELADCGTNCIDYKKVQFADYETSVPDIKIVGADIEKLIMDIPIVIHNPSIRDTETVKIDFDVYMEGRHLTKGVIPATELPAKQNTTIVIKDVEIKYKELDEVFQVLVAKHGMNMVREGKANISMTTDLLIYFPIEVFSMNIYTFKIPVQIETEIPVDMLKQNEEAKKQIEEKVKMTIKEVEDKIEEALPALVPTEEQGAPLTFV